MTRLSAESYSYRASKIRSDLEHSVGHSISFLKRNGEIELEKIERKRARSIEFKTMGE